MKSRKFKWGNPLFVAFLAIAGIFSVSSALLNKGAENKNDTKIAEAYNYNFYRDDPYWYVKGDFNSWGIDSAHHFTYSKDVGNNWEYQSDTVFTVDNGQGFKFWHNYNEDGKPNWFSPTLESSASALFHYGGNGNIYPSNSRDLRVRLYLQVYGQKATYQGLYAEEVACTITYNVNDGSDSPSTYTDPSTYTYKTSQTSKKWSDTGFTMTPLRTSFTGWNTSPDGTGTAIAANTSFTVTGDMTLYAQYNYADVQYSINGGAYTTLSKNSRNEYELSDFIQNYYVLGVSQTSGQTFSLKVNGSIVSASNISCITTSDDSNKGMLNNLQKIGSTLSFRYSGLTGAIDVEAYNDNGTAKYKVYAHGLHDTNAENYSILKNNNEFIYCAADGTDAHGHTQYKATDVLITESDTITFIHRNADYSSSQDYPNPYSPKYPETEDENELTISGGGATVQSGKDGYYTVYIMQEHNNNYIDVIHGVKTGFKVTFNRNGHGNETNPKYVKNNSGTGEKISAPTAPTETGYLFGGWYTDDDCETKDEFIFATTYVTADITLYAKWTAKTSALTFNLNEATGGGSAPTGKVATYDSDMPAYGNSAPTKTGYIFGGFYDGSTGSGTQYYTNTLASARTWDKDTTSGTTLYAKWTAKTSALTFNLNGGSGTAPTSRTATYDSDMPSISAIAAPTKTGYTFAGYYDGEGGTGTQYYTSALASARTWDKDTTSGTTLYAKWTPNDDTAYTVKHYKQNIDGTYPSTPTDTDNLTGTTGASVTPARKSYTGFTAPAGQTVTILADGSRVVTYQYTRNSYILTWDGNGGTLDGESIISDSVKYGDSISEPSEVSREGYDFAGWDTTPASTMPAANTTYTAQWSVNSYNLTLTISEGIGTIYYKVNNAANYSSTTSTITVSVTYGTTYYVYATKANNGYILNSPYSTYTSANPYNATKGASAETWAPTATSGETAAINFAKDFNSDVGGVCSTYDSNTKASFIAVWNTDGTKDRMEYNYSRLADYQKYWLAEATKSSDSNVTEMLGKYDYILSKYGYGTGSDNIHDFLGRTPTPKNAISFFSPLSLFGEEDNLSTVIIIVASSVALLSVTALSILVIKKRKNKEE